MSDNEVIEGHCFTETKIRKVRFVWKIDKFSTKTEELRSAMFPTSAPQNIGKWELVLKPNISEQDNYNTMSGISTYSKNLLLYIYQQSDENVLARVKSSLINDKGSVAQSEVIACQIINKKCGGKLLLRLKNRDVALKENCLLHNDELTIVCEIDIDCLEIRYQEVDPTKFELPLCRLVDDMSKLLSSNSLTDVSITVGGRAFRAHKAILAARSSVFAAMFSNDMDEKKISTVEITDIPPDVFQEMLTYIYTDKKTSQNRELLAAASKYELKTLKLMCEEALCNELSVDNVLEKIILAEHYNASYLKETAVSFAARNGSHVIGSLSWVNFKRSHQSLAMEILEKCIFK